jgi:hypothetical protein
VDHPAEETLKRFASGAATPQENRAVVVHLLKGCADCSVKLRSFLEPESVPDQTYEGVLDRFDAGLLETLEMSVSFRPPLSRGVGVSLGERGKGE